MSRTTILRIQLSVALVVAILGTAAISIYFVTRSARSAALIQAKSELSRSIDGLSSELQFYISSVVQQIQTAANDPVFTSRLVNQQEESLPGLSSTEDRGVGLSRANQYYRSSSTTIFTKNAMISIFDADFNLIYHSGEPNRYGVRAFISLLHRADKEGIGVTIPSPKEFKELANKLQVQASAQQMLLIAHPIDRGGSRLGYVILGNPLDKFISEAEQRHNCRVALKVGSGQFYQRAAADLDEDLVTFTQALRLTSPNVQIGEIEVSRNLTSQLKPTIDMIYRSSGLAAGLSALFALVGAFFLSNFLAQPIEALRIIAAKASQDLSKPILQDDPKAKDVSLNVVVEDIASTIQNQDRLQQLHQRYIPKSVSDAFMKNPDAIEFGGNRVDVSLVAVEISNAYKYADKLDPGFVIDSLNSMYQDLSQPMVDLGAAIERYSGEGVQFLFGAPIEMPKAALQAVQAAAQAIDKSAVRLIKLQNTGFKDVQFSVGIATGSGTFGRVGSQYQRDYGVVGLHGIKARALCKLAHTIGTRCLIDSETAKKLPIKGRIRGEPGFQVPAGGIIIRRVGRFDLGMGLHPEEIFEVLSPVMLEKGYATEFLYLFKKAVSEWEAKNFVASKESLKSALKIQPTEGVALELMSRVKKALAAASPKASAQPQASAPPAAQTKQQEQTDDDFKFDPDF